MAVDVQHAEQGKTVRIDFVVVSGGTPYNPSSLTADIYDSSGSLVTNLVPQFSGRAGHYFVEWDISRTQPTGVYRLAVNADSGTFTDDIYFEVYAEDTFKESSASTSQSLVTVLDKLSRAKDEDIFVAVVRTILRDHPQLNRLTKGRETSDGEIKIAMAMAISQYNSTPPPITPVQFNNFPSIAMLVIGTISWVLQSSTFLRVRNTLQYSDGGVSVESENAAAYQALVQQLGTAYQAWIQEYKKSANVAAAFGTSPTGVHSEYYLLAYFLGDAFVSGEVILA